MFGKVAGVHRRLTLDYEAAAIMEGIRYFNLKNLFVRIQIATPDLA
jgi:hypothetical protein